MRESVSTKQLIAFGIGFSSTNAWWLAFVDTSSYLTLSKTLLSSLSIIIDASFFVTTIACAVKSDTLQRFFFSSHAEILFPLTAALFTGFSFILTLLPTISTVFYVLAVFCAGSSIAVTFLTWMMRFVSYLDKGTSPFVLLFAMVGTILLAQLCTLFPIAVSVIFTISLPILALVTQWYLIKQEGSSVTKPSQASTSSLPVARMKFGELFPPLFVFGIVLYELAPGFISGINTGYHPEVPQTASVSYLPYAAVILSFAIFGAWYSRRKKTASENFVNLVVPLFSLGLFGISFLTGEYHELTSVIILSTSTLFEMFIYTTFARLSLATEESPLRVYGFGCGLIQATLFVSYVAGIYLAESAQTWISGIALAIVFLFIIDGTFTVSDTGVGIPSRTKQLFFHKEAPETVSSSVEESQAQRFARQYELSEKETEVLILLTRGKSIQVIADELYIAHSTAKTYVSRIYAKVGVNKRQELLRLIDEIK